jgi:DNA-binding transcriptional LysR family regulator
LVRIPQLQYFLAVVDEGSFTKAAVRLSVAQPSLSQQIAALEKDVGGRLLERMPRGVRLTNAGRAFEPEARAAVAAVARARRAVRTTLDLHGGELEIATVLSVASGLLPPVISRWHSAHPGVTIGLREFRHKDALEDAVLDGVGDLAIGPRPLHWTGPVVSLGFERFVIVLPENDPLATLDRIKLSMLADRDWVLFEREHGLSELVDAICAAAGFTPRGSVRTSQSDACARLAASGIGPALLPANVVPPGLKAAVVNVDPPLVREQTVYARGELTNMAQSFIQALRATADRMPAFTSTQPEHSKLV